LVAAAATATVASEEINNIIRTGDLARLQALAEKFPALLQFKDERGRTLLHWAAAAGQLDMARWLSEHGAEVDARTVEMSTPLIHAALAGKAEMARLLIAKGADLGARNNYQRTAIILVGRETGDAEMAAILLDAGADINAVDSSQDSALSLAAWRGFSALVDLLLDRGAALPEAGEGRIQLFSHSLTKGLDKLFDRLLAAGVDLSRKDSLQGNALHAATDGGSGHILETLLEKKLDVNLRDRNGWTPLHRACERGRTQAATLLIARGARLDERTLAGETPYNLAVNEQNAEVASLLKVKGADQGPPDFPALAGPYFGQKKPGATPEPFAVGIVNGRFGLHCAPVFSPDGREAYWNLMIQPRAAGFSISRLLVSRLRDGRWTYPEIAPFTGEGMDADVPCFTPDGKRLYFMSRRLMPGETQPTGEHIWFMEREQDGWSLPRPVDETVNRFPLHWQFAVDKDYNLYIHANVSGSLGDSDLYFAQYANGRYLEPKNLGAPLNSPGREETPGIAADSSYLLFQRDSDIHVSFRNLDGSWGEPVNLGPEVNSPGPDICPQVTADGKNLFFLGRWNACWVSTSVIERLRPAAAEKSVIEKIIRDNIGWAQTKDRPLLESTMAQNERLFIFNPDSEITRGWEQFAKNFDFWLDPRFKATGLDIRDLRIDLSPLGDAAWWSCILDDLYEWNGKPGAWKDTRWTGVLVKRQGQWRIVQMHFSFAADKVAAEAKAKLAQAAAAAAEKSVEN
jgi:ankyrin repeat protein/ketosteroid isomerase-like protein